jgi:hypothetical protein
MACYYAQQINMPEGEIMATKAPVQAPANDRGVAVKLEERLSQEVIFALVGPVGSGVSTTAEFLRKTLESEYNYDVAPIMKPSDVIREQSTLIGKVAPQDNKTSDYIDRMQTLGNELRKAFGHNYLIEKVIEKIRIFRDARGGYEATLSCLDAGRTS